MAKYLSEDESESKRQEPIQEKEIKLNTYLRTYHKKQNQSLCQPIKTILQLELT